MLRIRLAFLLAFGLGLPILAAGAQAPSEAACLAGDAEACFYAGAEYAQGAGVAEDKLKAVTFFLKSCELGVPDGCSTSGYLISRGEGNIPKDVVRGVEYMERACAMGHVDGCDWSIGMRISPGSAANNFSRALETAKAGCAAGVKKPCFWGLDWTWDGAEGKYPQMIDPTRASWFAETVCETYRDERACSIAARLFADPEAATFDPQKGMLYSMIRCDEQKSGGDCRNVAGVYLNIEEYEIGATYMRRACQYGLTDACDNATAWETYVRELAAYEAKLEMQKAQFDVPLAAGRYSEALKFAIHEAGSLDLAEKAVLATREARRMGQLETYDLYAVALWFQSGPVRAAADAELAARGTGLEGRFGTGTNEPGMADARWRDLYGSSAPTYRSSASTFTPSATPSMASIQEETKRRYRWAHCTMRGNSGTAKVCQ